MKKYAKLIAKVGANVQTGQAVIINAEVEAQEFVEILVKQCYKAGASEVTVEWQCQELTPLHVNYRSVKVLSEVKNWELEKVKHRVEVLPAIIHILSEDPDGLSNINIKKWSESTQARQKILKPYRDEMEGRHQWCIAAIPGKKWAKKVFPKLSTKKAVEKMWDSILKASRADGANPVKEWAEHNKDLKKRCDYLNSLNIRTLEYKSANGTDLRVGLMEQSMFVGGSERTRKTSVKFNPNIPSEEVFTSPDKSTAEGMVYSSMPFSYRGALIENFWLKFEGGRVTDFGAEKNEAALKALLDMDEGARMLGECALVPYDSPIRNSGIMYYNTLFDENAACHLALGSGYRDAIKGGHELSLAECHAFGMNDSIVHEDFMIGTEDLSIVGVDAEGKRHEIFTKGNWAK